MTTLKEHARAATATLQSALQTAPNNFDADQTATVIELAIRKATRERESLARERLREAQAAAHERLERLLSSSPAVIYSFKATGDFAPTFVSDNIIKVFGYPPTEYLEDPSFWRERVHPEDRTRVETEIARFFQNGVHTVEYRFRRKDDSYCWVNDEQHLIRGADSKPLEIVGSWSDISKRKAAEEAKATAHSRLSLLLACSPAVIYSYKAAGDFAPTFVSENITALLGYQPSEYLENADFWRRKVHPEDLAAVEANIAQLFKTGRLTAEYRFLKRDGAYCWVNDEQRLVRDHNGQPTEVIGSWSDVSERKQAEQAATAARDRVERLLASSPAVLYSYKPTGDYAPTFISQNVKDLLGYDREEYLESADFWLSRVHPDDSPRVLKQYSRLMEHGRLSVEYRFRKKDGGYCWIGDELHLVRNAAGDPIEVVGSWSDITARKNIGEALVAAQDRIGHLLSAAPAVIYSYKATGDFAPTFVSRNIKDLFGYDPQQYLESADFWRRCVHPEDIAAVEAHVVQLFRKGAHRFEYRFLTKDGSYCWVSDDQRLVRDKDGQPVEVVGSWSDVTAAKEVDMAFRDSQQRLTDALESISEGFSLYDSQDLLVVCNRAYGEILYPGSGMPSRGTPFETIVRNAAEQGMVDGAKGRAAEWIADRVARHRSPGEPHVQRRADGRWIQINERKTAEGGTVAVYTDITAIKNAEEEIREANRKAELANALINEQKLELEVLSTKLSKYLSPQVYSSIFTGQRGVEIASSRKKLTVFFSDIADFTATTDDLESEELTGLLNHYLTEMSKIALEHGATVDKYIGDAIVAFFGDPETRGVREDALACVNMAIAMQRRLRDLQSEWRDSGMQRPFQMRIGVNTGYCTVGNFGSEDRMDYTIIGSPVNLAARLQSNGEPGGILLSHETYSLVKEAIRAEEQAPIQVKGFSKPIRNYKVVAQFDDASQTPVIREEQDGLRIFMDFRKLDKASAVAALRSMLSKLES
jgi:adenylate cyclase